MVACIHTCKSEDESDDISYSDKDGRIRGLCVSGRLSPIPETQAKEPFHYFASVPTHAAHKYPHDYPFVDSANSLLRYMKD